MAIGTTADDDTLPIGRAVTCWTILCWNNVEDWMSDVGTGGGGPLRAPLRFHPPPPPPPPPQTPTPAPFLFLPVDATISGLFLFYDCWLTLRSIDWSPKKLFFPFSIKSNSIISSFNSIFFRLLIIAGYFLGRLSYAAHGALSERVQKRTSAGVIGVIHQNRKGLEWLGWRAKMSRLSG